MSNEKYYVIYSSLSKRKSQVVECETEDQAGQFCQNMTIPSENNPLFLQGSVTAVFRGTQLDVGDMLLRSFERGQTPMMGERGQTQP